jgi:hypothetical protein
VSFIAAIMIVASTIAVKTTADIFIFLFFFLIGN